MQKIVVLGTGRVGSAIAVDLSKSFDVLAVDKNPELLNRLKNGRGMSTEVADLTDQDRIKYLINDAALVIGAVPGSMGFRTLKAVIEAGKNVVDISFGPEDYFELDELAKSRGVTAVVDCGVAPGMSNMFPGFFAKQMQIEKYTCFVGGLPLVGIKYKAPFSPADVIEEYLRPARLMKNGKVTIVPAMSNRKLITFEKVGILEAFNTDGLRSLLCTMKGVIPNMSEKTLRRRGYIEEIQNMYDAGFFGKEPVEIDGKLIRPIDFTSKLLTDSWKMRDTEMDFTVMRMVFEGSYGGQNKQIIIDMYDEYDGSSGTSSMARVTGYPCAATAYLVLSKCFNRKGICPPEYIGETGSCFKMVLSYLLKRNIVFKQKETWS